MPTSCLSIGPFPISLTWSDWQAPLLYTCLPDRPAPSAEPRSVAQALLPVLLALFSFFPVALAPRRAANL
jgi:hypothetical protein